MKKVIAGAGVFLILFFPVMIFAKDLGVWGQVYLIKEQDFLFFIKNKLVKLQNEGALESAKKDFIKRSKEHILRPHAVNGLSTTNNPQVFYYDPSFILQHNITDAMGQVLYKKGLTVNPLNKISFKQIWIFFDADDARQLSWASAKIKSLQQVKPILVKGNIKKAVKALGVRVYFDQQGVFTRKFRLKHIPVVISESHKKLKIQEENINKLSEAQDEI